MSGRSGSTAQRLFSVYYAGTAVFLALDYLFSVNVRLAFLDDWPVWRAVYYVFCIACFFAIRRYPAWANTIAAGESLVNLSGLIISVASRVMTPSAAVLDGEGTILTIEELQNFVLSGGVAWFAWHLRSRAAFEELSSRPAGRFLVSGKTSQNREKRD